MGQQRRWKLPGSPLSALGTKNGCGCDNHEVITRELFKVERSAILKVNAFKVKNKKYYNYKENIQIKKM